MAQALLAPEIFLFIIFLLLRAPLVCMNAEQYFAVHPGTNSNCPLKKGK